MRRTVNPTGEESMQMLWLRRFMQLELLAHIAIAQLSHHGRQHRLVGAQQSLVQPKREGALGRVT